MTALLEVVADAGHLAHRSQPGAPVHDPAVWRALLAAHATADTTP